MYQVFWDTRYNTSQILIAITPFFFLFTCLTGYLTPNSLLYCTYVAEPSLCLHPTLLQKLLLFSKTHGQKREPKLLRLAGPLNIQQFNLFSDKSNCKIFVAYSTPKKY